VSLRYDFSYDGGGRGKGGLGALFVNGRKVAEGRIDRTLPFVRAKAVELLRAPYASREAASREIGAALDAYYRSAYPDVARDAAKAIVQAAEQIRAIYLRNVFPSMNLTWGTHPNHVGHADQKGCFRCHDGQHVAADGRTITDDCSACHTILAQEEEAPKILADLGIGG